MHEARAAAPLLVASGAADLMPLCPFKGLQNWNYYQLHHGEHSSGFWHLFLKGNCPGLHVHL